MADSLELLQRELLAERDRYNTLYAVARRARPRLEAGLFEHNLKRYLAPLLHQPSTALTPELYEVVLELTGVELFDRSPAVRALWEELLPKAGPLLTTAPGRTVACLTNAVYNLESEPGADWRFWLSRMEKSLSVCQNGEMWLQVAQVLAWVAGMAHYRESAQELAARLPAEVTEALIPRWDRVSHDPWWPRRPQDTGLIPVHTVGGFLGFGGPFRKPPEVITAAAERFLVSDGANDWMLYSDGFGATLKRVHDVDLQDGEAQKVTVSDGGEIEWAGKRFSFPELGPVSGFAVSGQLLAVTGALTHKVSVFLRNFEV